MYYLLLDLAGDGRVSGVGNTLAAFVLHVDGICGLCCFEFGLKMKVEVMICKGEDEGLTELYISYLRL